MKQSVLLLFIISIFMIHPSINAQEVVRNLGFEKVDASNHLISWLPYTTKYYRGMIDTTVFHSGKCSLFMTSETKDSSRGQCGAYSQLIINDLASKKKIRITGFIKTENLSDGVAILDLRLDGEDGSNAEKSSEYINTNDGTSDWKEYSVELPLIPNIRQITFGVRTTGIGKVWFDDLGIFIDDVPVSDSPSL